jgi:hypothetical protein
LDLNLKHKKIITNKKYTNLKFLLLESDCWASINTGINPRMIPIRIRQRIIPNMANKIFNLHKQLVKNILKLSFSKIDN